MGVSGELFWVGRGGALCWVGGDRWVNILGGWG